VFNPVCGSFAVQIQKAITGGLTCIDRPDVVWRNDQVIALCSRGLGWTLGHYAFI